MAAVLAHPIKHSLSPFIHNLAFELTDENAVYLAWELEDEKMLEQTINNVRTLDMYGLNISMPYKQKAVEFIDELSEEAELIGAVNTIVNQKGKKVCDKYNKNERMRLGIMRIVQHLKLW